ncbi:mitochondrial carrier family protein [Cyclospora cayetanensis]|uniref:Mitochondrial carrier family protein n=1 Tax=Cyclospora cayetanensis TaxID=88456 RepID=A0A1D3D6H1_9EIME|nr:mitochondrial carrier family protein [Cyclospora cayetanensis]
MSSLQVATKLYRAKGPLIFWRGVGPAVGVLVPANIIFFTLYERRDPEGSAAVAGVAARTAAVICTAPIELRFRDGAVIPFLSGASSAAVACVLTHPFDVVKTRVQASQLRPQGPSGAASGGPLWYFFRGVREACTEVYGANGFRGFGVGLLPRLLKIVPSCAVLLATYEATKALCGSSLLDQT